jgi:hypothetical protein
LRWIYKIKPGSSGKPDRYKARLVAHGFEQRAGVDYEDVFAPVAKYNTIKAISAIAKTQDWDVHHLDFMIAYLNGKLRQTVYMKQPLGYVRPDSEHLVCKLNKALYGLKQAGHEWYTRIDKFLHKTFLKQSFQDGNLYYQKQNGKTVVLVLYVDDLFITGNGISGINQFKHRLKSKFKTTDLGLITKYLGLEFQKSPDGLVVHQTTYAQNIVDEFGLTNCNPCKSPLLAGLKLSKKTKTPPVNQTLYRRMVEKLLFLTITQANIAFAVNLVSRYMENPQETHMKAIKSIIRHLQGNTSLGLLYRKGASLEFTGYSDAD